MGFDAFVGPTDVAAGAPSFAQSLFDRPPIRVMIHSPQSTEGLRNRATISVVVPEDSGTSSEAIVLRQLLNLDRWDWVRLKPRDLSRRLFPSRQRNKRI